MNTITTVAAITALLGLLAAVNTLLQSRRLKNERTRIEQRQSEDLNKPPFKNVGSINISINKA
ncbi:MAG: hypothetical protein QOK48_1307 [Blastocatellia bacterium]|jgi:hypothetical protein|nr:hypothetical protein [Blastocatellia bacterium]